MREEIQGITVEDEYGFPVKVSYRTAYKIYDKLGKRFKAADIRNKIEQIDEDTYSEHEKILQEAYDSAEDIVEYLENRLSKIDEYWDIYWDSIDGAIDDFIKSKKKGDK